MASVGLGRVMWCGVVSVWLKVGDRKGISFLQLPMLQPWMVMGLGICIQNEGVRGPGFEGPMQDTALDWIPYPQGTEHWRQNSDDFLQLLHSCCKWSPFSLLNHAAGPGGIFFSMQHGGQAQLSITGTLFINII